MDSSRAGLVPSNANTEQPAGRDGAVAARSIRARIGAGRVKDVRALRIADAGICWADAITRGTGDAFFCVLVAAGRRAASVR